MSIKNKITLFTLLIFAATCSASEFRVLNNEKWYGLKADTPTLIDSKNKIGTPTFLISTRGRYIYAESPFTATLSSNRISIDKENIEAVSAGKSLRSAYLVLYHKHLKEETPVKIPTELFSSPLYDLRNAREYLKVDGQLVATAEKIVNDGWPKGTLLLGDDWQTVPGNYIPDEEYYTDIQEQIAKLHSLGWRVILSISPCVSASGRAYNKARHNEMLISSNGKPKITETNAGYVAVYDATNQQVADHINTRLNELIKRFPVDGLYADVSPYYNTINDNQKAQEQARQWNNICQQITLPLNLRSTASTRTDITLIPYDYQQIISAEFVHKSVYSDFLYAPLSSAIISSNGLPEGDTYKRDYLQRTVLCPIFVVPFLPYEIQSEEIRKDCRAIAEVRTSMNTYIDETLRESQLTGEPLVRPVEYMSPKQGFFDCNEQYMLGSKYIVIPPKQPRTTVRLPRGSWFGHNDKRIHGPVVKFFTADKHPLYFRSTK